MVRKKLHFLEAPLAALRSVSFYQHKVMWREVSMLRVPAHFDEHEEGCGNK